MSQAGGLDRRHRSSLTDDYQFELRDHARLRRQRRRQRSRSPSTHRAEGTLGALNPRLSYPHQHHGRAIAMRAPRTIIHRADCDFVHACLAHRPRLTSAIFACVILAGSFFRHTNLRTLLALYTRSYMHVSTRRYVACAVKPLYDEHGFKHVIL